MVAADGALDLGSAPPLKQTLSELAREGFSRIVVDLSEVTFMDSTALAVLVGLKRRLSPSGVLAVAGANPQALQLFELTALDRAIQLFPSVEAAIASLGGSDQRESHPPVSPLPLTGDAAIVLGIAATAMPFASSREDQVERWLHALRLHGEAGMVLASVGFADEPPNGESAQPGSERGPLGRDRDEDVVAAVTDQARRIAGGQGASMTRTAHLLAAVVDCYGPECERVLEGHGVATDDLAALLEADLPDR